MAVDLEKAWRELIHSISVLTEGRIIHWRRDAGDLRMDLTLILEIDAPASLVPEFGPPPDPDPRAKYVRELTVWNTTVDEKLRVINPQIHTYGSIENESVEYLSDLAFGDPDIRK